MVGELANTGITLMPGAKLYGGGGSVSRFETGIVAEEGAEIKYMQSAGNAERGIRLQGDNNVLKWVDASKNGRSASPGVHFAFGIFIGNA